MPHHLGDVSTEAGTAIVTGDPDRVPHLAEAVGTPRGSWSRRGYVGTEVDADGSPLLVCSTGIGGPTTGIVVEELAQLGLQQIVRVGTCGSMQPHVGAGELVISAASVREDGTSRQYLPLEFPAVADPALLAAIVAAAREDERPHHVGITHCKDAYYAESPEQMPMTRQWQERWAAWRAAGVLATEMEVAALYVIAAVRRIRAAAVLIAVDGTLSAQAASAAIQGGARIAASGALALERGIRAVPR